MHILESPLLTSLLTSLLQRPVRQLPLEHVLPSVLEDGCEAPSLGHSVANHVSIL